MISPEIVFEGEVGFVNLSLFLPCDVRLQSPHCVHVILVPFFLAPGAEIGPGDLADVASNLKLNIDKLSSSQQTFFFFFCDAFFLPTVI